MNNSAKDSGEAIEKVLAGLRDVEAPSGLERRILDGLEKRAAQTRVRSQWFGLGWYGVSVSYLVCGVALGVFVLAVAVPAVRRFGHAPAQAKIGVAPVMTTPAVSSGVAAVVTEPALHERDARQMEADAQRKGLVRVAGSVAGSAADSEDSVAMSETRAASFPAPPMPLTEQERLLLRMPHRGDREELAMLDPKLRELSEVKEKEEFQMFFARASAEQILARQAAMERAARSPEAGDQATAGRSNKEQITKESSTPATEESTPEQPTAEQLAPGQSTTEKSTPERQPPTELRW